MISLAGANPGSIAGVPGSPNKRRRREAAEAAAAAAAQPEIPEAVRAPEPAPAAANAGGNARSRARARGFEPPPAVARRDVTSGPGVRTTADKVNAAAVETLARYIRPGLVLRIFRTRPLWCAGFVEDYPIEANEGYAHVLLHLRDEHGGVMYKVQVLGAGETILYESSLPIAGPPRANGRVINRSRWEGTEEPERAPSTQIAPAAAGGDAGALAIVQLVLERAERSNQAQLETVRQLVQETREQTTSLLNTIVHGRSEEQHRASLAGQLEDFATAAKSIDKVRKQMFGAAAGNTGPGDDDDTDPIVKEAKTHFARAMFGTMFQPSQQQQQPARNAQHRPNPQQIPEARRSSRTNGRR